MWVPHVERIERCTGDLLIQPGVAAKHMYFPITAVVSLTVDHADGSGVDFALVGREGFVGFFRFLPKPVVLGSATVQCPGTLYRVQADIALAAKTLFPFVMSRCLFVHFWNASASPAGPVIDPTTGAPHIFQLGQNFETPPCGTLQGFWTSYATIDNSASGIRQLLETRNSDPLRVGDDIWLPTGVMNTVYSALSRLLETCVGTSASACDEVIVAVIDDPEPGQWAQIQAFACIRILSADGGSNPNARVQMKTECDTTGTGGVGPPLIVGYPKLVR